VLTRTTITKQNRR